MKINSPSEYGKKVAQEMNGLNTEPSEQLLEIGKQLTKLCTLPLPLLRTYNSVVASEQFEKEHRMIEEVLKHE